MLRQSVRKAEQVCTCDALSAAHMQHMQMRTEARSPLVGSEHEDMCISVHVVHRNTQEYIRIYVAISMFGFRSVKSVLWGPV